MGVGYLNEASRSFPWLLLEIIAGFGTSFFTQVSTAIFTNITQLCVSTLARYCRIATKALNYKNNF
jgi:hypothetical protein